MSIKVTIGVCVKDSEKTIKESIDSIINQKYPKELLQIVIVDGCSKDKTLPIIASLTSKANARVEIYSDEGKGLGAARQIAVNHTNGKYMIFVDADVRILNDFIEKHVRYMEENPDVCIAFGRPMRPMRQGETLLSAVISLCDYATDGHIGCHATIFRSEALRQVGGFDANIKGAAEDRDVIARSRAKGWLVSTNEKARFFHKNRDNFRDFWKEQKWFGYGDHYLNHKHKKSDPVSHRLPAVMFIYGLRIALKAYKLTHRKMSFLIPLQMVLGSTAWWVGYVKGHMDGYGHEIK
jgi:glycosyltransferase involved in cell wall biosynthesis